MRLALTLSFISTTFCLQVAALAGEVDATARMNQLLESKPKVLYYHLEANYFGSREWREPGAAKVANSFVAEVQALQFEKAKIRKLPEAALYTHKTIQNCADATTTSTVQLGVSGTRSWSVSKTDGVTTTTGANINGTVGVPGVGSLGMTLSWSQAISTSTTRTEGMQEQTSRSMSDTVSIGPRKAVDIALVAYQAAVEIPFSAVVVVDGDLVANESNMQRASQLLSKEERTFPINGMLRVNDVSEARIRTENLHGAAGCDGQNGKTIFLADSSDMAFPASGISRDWQSTFVPLQKATRTDASLAPSSRVFGATRPAGMDDGAIIGAPADGTYYEVLYTTETAKPAIECGYNDLGVANTGIFTVEARQYRTYLNGKLIGQHQEFAETFKSCFNP